MTKDLTIQLNEERAAQLAQVGARLGLSDEQVLELALNVCLSEWREMMFELGVCEAPLHVH
jgi:hypothetical protein